MERIDKLMSAPPVVVSADTSLAECAERMVVNDLRHLPVVDGSGRLLGVVMDWALAREGWWTANDPYRRRGGTARTSGDLARPVEVQCRADDEAADVLTRLGRAFQDVAIVVDADRRPVGVVTEHDGVVAATRVLDDLVWSTDFVRRPLCWVSREDQAAEAWSRMARARVRHLLVMTGRALFGVLSFRDLAALGDPRVVVEDIVGRVPPHHAVGAVSLVDAARLMAAEKIGILPIVDEFMRPVQAITRTDLLVELVCALDRACALPQRPLGRPTVVGHSL